jgi:hypothetical protein
MDATVKTTRAAALAAALVVTLAACGSASMSAPLGPGREQLKAGAHVLDLVAREQPGSGPAHAPKIEVTVPAGWFNYKGIAVGQGRRLPHTTFVFFWHVAQVYPTPCNWKGKAMVDPGPSVGGLATALARQPLRNATTPTDTVLADYQGKYLELSVPKTINFSHCDQGYFESWTADGWASDRYQQRPGQVDQIWILKVHGVRLLVDAAYLPEATSQDRAELERVVDSIRFID